MKLLTKEISVGGDVLKIFHPDGDDTVWGTLDCLSHNRFHLDKHNLNNKVFLDIGCNVGLVSLVAAKLYPQATVYSFDASELSIVCLKLSCAANGIWNVHPFNRAIGIKNERVGFYSNGKEFSCLAEEGLNTSNPKFDSIVSKISVDEVFDSKLLGIGDVELLKSDIEGAEFSVFNHLFDNRPDILSRIKNLHIEIHPYKELNPEGLKERLSKHFGEKVCFDT